MNLLHPELSVTIIIEPPKVRFGISQEGFENIVFLVRANQKTVVLEETNQNIVLLVRASQCPCEKVSWALLNIVLNESLDYHNINTLYFISRN